jgi:hypothetical protein
MGADLLVPSVYLVDHRSVLLMSRIPYAEYRRLEIRGADHLLAGARSGPPVLLLHRPPHRGRFGKVVLSIDAPVP